MARYSRHNGNVVPFPKPTRPPKAKSKRLGFGITPIIVMLPLAAFTAVFAWGGGPKGWALPVDGNKTASGRPVPSRFSLLPVHKNGPEPGSQISGQFSLCQGAIRVTCVVDGDTFWLNGSKVRIADINTPEVSNPSCSAEARLGEEATQRLAELLNEAPFSLVSVERDRDIYGRTLRKVMREGRSLGSQLVAEGLAEPWQGRRGNWCGAASPG